MIEAIKRPGDKSNSLQLRQTAMKAIIFNTAELQVKLLLFSFVELSK